MLQSSASADGSSENIRNGAIVTAGSAEGAEARAGIIQLQPSFPILAESVALPALSSLVRQAQLSQSVFSNMRPDCTTGKGKVSTSFSANLKGAGLSGLVIEPAWSYRPRGSSSLRRVSLKADISLLRSLIHRSAVRNSCRSSQRRISSRAALNHSKKVISINPAQARGRVKD
jgi:hypothetical protein